MGIEDEMREEKIRMAKLDAENAKVIEARHAREARESREDTGPNYRDDDIYLHRNQHGDITGIESNHGYQKITPKQHIVDRVREPPQRLKEVLPGEKVKPSWQRERPGRVEELREKVNSFREDLRRKADDNRVRQDASESKRLERQEHKLDRELRRLKVQEKQQSVAIRKGRIEKRASSTELFSRSSVQSGMMGGHMFDFGGPSYGGESYVGSSAGISGNMGLFSSPAPKKQPQEQPKKRGKGGDVHIHVHR